MSTLSSAVWTFLAEISARLPDFLGTSIVPKTAWIVQFELDNAIVLNKMYDLGVTYFQAIFLAIVQGLTEFLPISSSGHLVIFQEFFGLEVPVLFDVLVHVGTLLAILFFFRLQLLKISKKTIFLVFIGTIPAAIIGFFLEKHISQIFDSVKLVSFSLLITAGLLFFTKWSTRDFAGARKKQLNWLDALFIGVLQAVAILPGVSRSGATISAGLLRKLDAEIAFEYSFFLAIPAIGGALFLQFPENLVSSPGFWGKGILGMLIAGVVGFFSLRLLYNTLKSAKLFYFGFYCLVLGILLLVTSRF